jgi:hypothetical protein
MSSIPHCQKALDGDGRELELVQLNESILLERRRIIFSDIETMEHATLTIASCCGSDSSMGYIQQELASGTRSVPSSYQDQDSSGPQDLEKT